MSKTDSSTSIDARREKRRKYEAEWRARNREKVRVYHKGWRDSNRDRIRKQPSVINRPRKTSRRVSFWNLE